MRAARAGGWFALGWLCCVAQGLWGSKLHDSLEGTRLYHLWMRWLTWQGATEGQRYRWLTVRELADLDGDDRHDWVPTDNDDMGSKQ
jgi:hypothetical protein